MLFMVRNKLVHVNKAKYTSLCTSRIDHNKHSQTLEEIMCLKFLTHGEYKYDLSNCVSVFLYLVWCFGKLCQLSCNRVCILISCREFCCAESLYALLFVVPCSFTQSCYSYPWGLIVCSNKQNKYHEHTLTTTASQQFTTTFKLLHVLHFLVVYGFTRRWYY